MYIYLCYFNTFQFSYFIYMLVINTIQILSQKNFSFIIEFYNRIQRPRITIIHINKNTVYKLFYNLSFFLYFNVKEM